MDSFEYLYGREQQLDQIKQAMFSPGRHIVIYRDRGVGKTSLARTAAFQHHPSAGEPIIVACGTGTTFVTLMNDVACQLAARRSHKHIKETTITAFGFGGVKVERTVETVQQSNQGPGHKFGNRCLKTLIG
jgi:ABC-type molybdenum transport system ATPase subunit/photorepair protein PhrA